MNDGDYLQHWHIVYTLPIWTFGTWIILMILAWCLITLKRMVERLDDKVDEMGGKMDAYFGLPRLDVEAIRIRDMETRYIRSTEMDEQEKRATCEEAEGDELGEDEAVHGERD
jgi:hypothetical protein